MKTSDQQMEMLIEFMETNGDITKKSTNARGHVFMKKKWSELERKLNSDGSGASRDVQGWRKVWSDLKNNTKKKFSKVNGILQRKTGGGPRAPIITTQDRRVMAILGEVAATGMSVPEIGFNQEPDDTDSEQVPIVIIKVADEDAGPSVELPADDDMFDGYEDLNEARPQSTHVTLPVPPMPLLQPTDQSDTAVWKPSAKKRKLFTSITRAETASKAFLEAQERDREYERERDRRYEELERERIRQRDVELELQSQWLTLMREVLNVVNTFLNDRNK